MAQVSIQDLCDRGGELVDRATRGERITITRSGRAVAELRALPHTPLSAEALVSRWRRLPPVDPVALRADVDRLLKTPDFIGMAGSVVVPAGKRDTPWDEVLRQARVACAEHHR